jgi:hypothetical protein
MFRFLNHWIAGYRGPISKDGHPHRASTKARGPSRNCRFRLENLEGRSLLSTYTLSEFSLTPTVRAVVEQVDNHPPTITVNPPTPFVLSTGSGSNTVNILNTSAGLPIEIIGHGRDTVNVGSGGSVQGIRGAVSIENPPSFTTLNVDDSADPAARTATLSTITPAGDSPWGTITGLAPAAINFEYADTSSVHLTTGRVGDTVNVLATGVPTYLSSGGGRDTVNVGSGGSVQGIRGAVSIENPPSLTTLNVDDSADPAWRFAHLDTITPAGDSSWGAITGLAPAAINFEWADVSSPVNIFDRSVQWDVSAQATFPGVVPVYENGNLLNGYRPY